MCILAVLLALQLAAAEHSAPAGIRPALRRPGAASVLPGGRIISSLGIQQVTGPGPFGLAASPDGKTLVTANTGPERYSLTVVTRSRTLPWEVRHLVAPRARAGGQRDEDEWRGVAMGVAFANARQVFSSEGNSGRVRLVDLDSGRPRRIYNLNQGGFADSYTGDLAFDTERELLYVLDQANFRLVVIDTRGHRVLSSVRLGRLPYAIALSPDRRKVYVAHVGMFEYRAIPGGLMFPAFGFPSAEALAGARRETPAGPVDVPGLGDPNVREANSVWVVDVRDPSAPAVEATIRTGLPFGNDVHGGSSPSGVLAAAGRVFVSNAHNDSITVIDAATNAVSGEIPIRIPGLEHLRGVLPIGLAWHEPTGWLLAAEAGINAVGVIDVQAMKVIGHLPVSWFPTRVVVDGDTVVVANARGQGVGPSIGGDPFDTGTFSGTLRRGTVSVFTLPVASDLARHTRFVMEANGFVARPGEAAPLPAAIRHVVLIVKENRSFDEVLGDITEASNGKVVGFPPLARFGSRGYVAGNRRRLSIKNIAVTPNHHAIATRWAFSDNFYADSDGDTDGHHWVVGVCPNAWVESSRRAAFPGNRSSVHPEGQPEAGTLWHHLERHGISFRNFGAGLELAGASEGRYSTNAPLPDPLYRNTSRRYPPFNMRIPDQHRATQFMREIDDRYLKGGEEFPRFLFIHLPNDRMDLPRPEAGYPFEASYVADNDYALGRILEFLSGTRWWRNMVVFVTEDGAEGGRDHIDAHRTLLLAAGPWCKRDYVSHVNTSFPGLLKTIFRLLGMPPLNLFAAAASDLSDCFTTEPDFTRYVAQPVDPRVFDPRKAEPR